MSKFPSAAQAIDWYYWTTTAISSRGAERHAELEGPCVGAKSVMLPTPPRCGTDDRDMITRAEIGKALEKLSDCTWWIVIGVSIGMSFEEVARRMECSESTVQREFAKGIRQVARTLIEKAIIA